MPEKLQTLHMCDFCSREIETCGASPVLAQELKVGPDQLIKSNVVVACNKYGSPVDVLKKQFH